MKFCPACRNMLYAIDEDVVNDVKTAVLSCRKCEYKEPLSSDNPLVYEHILREDTTEKLVMNPYLEHDPTLDHLSNVVCPNKECPSRVSSIKGDVVPVKLDKDKLIWLYKCVHCKETWKQSSRAS